MRLKTIIAVILGVLFFVILVQNTQAVTLRFLFWELIVSRIILIPLLVFVGFVLGYVVAKIVKKGRDTNR